MGETEGEFVGTSLGCRVGSTNLHAIVKPFEMVSLWGVIDRSFFLCEHRMVQS